MLKINIEIDNKAFEDALAKNITLSEGDDLSKEFTKIVLDDLKSRANMGVERLSEDELKEAIVSATEQKKADFETIIESVKPKTIKR